MDEEVVLESSQEGVKKDPITGLPDRISYSSWQLYRNGCQHKWKLDVLEGRRAAAYSVHMDFGTAVHEAIEYSRARKPKITKEEAIPHFKKRFDELYEKNKTNYRENDLKADPDFFIKAGETILEKFDECKELLEAEVLYNEYKIYENIDRTDNVNMKFKGYVDMVIKTKDARDNTILYVCDFKSCSWGWPIEKRTDKELHFQILLYKHFICKKFNLDPKFVKTAFVLLKKRPRKGDSPIEFFPISAGPVSVQRAIDEINKDITDMADRVKNNNFIKNRENCVSKYGDKCPYVDTDLCTKG